MTLEQIKNFIALADFRNFTKAAERNFISQSSLSRSVASLENSLGIKLLERDTRYVTLTQAGEYLRDEGNRILDELYMLEAVLKDMSEGKIGHMMAFIPEFYFAPFSDSCRRFCDAFPEVEVEIEVERSWQISERVAMREADVGLTFGHEVDSPELDVRTVMTDKLAVLVPESHPLSGRSSVSLGELEPEEILFFGDSSFQGSGNGFAVPLSSLGQDHAPKFHIIRSMSTAFQRMYAGQGVVVLPRVIGAAQQTIGKCRLLELTDQDFEYRVVLVSRRDNPNPALKKFIEMFPAEEPKTE